MNTDELYHDDAPVTKAHFEIELENGSTFHGQLDNNGQSEIQTLNSRPIRIRFGPEPNPYQIVDKKIISPMEESLLGGKGIALSQIIVDACIEMIPLVRDVSAVRDIIAIVMGMAEDPKKRESKLEWLGLVVLLFALIPVIGGAIKGMGKLLVRGSKEAAVASRNLKEMIAGLNRFGMGDALKWLKDLNLENQSAELLGRWRELTHRLDLVFDTVLSKFKDLLPETMLKRLTLLKEQLEALAKKGEEMIPDAIKELNERLKA